jgi:cell division protein FtsB
VKGVANRHVDRRLVVGVLAVLAVIGLVIGADGMLRVWEMQRDLETLERDIAQLRAQTQKLSHTVDRLRNDPAYIEQLAREDLGYVREGETVLKFPSQRK